MRIQILSDLHLEFGEGNFSFDQADVVVLAGDVHIGTKGIEWILDTINDRPVVYVLGNHEYYKGAYPKTLEKIIEKAKGTNVHVLENKSITIENTCFHGATLWTDFSIFGDPRVYGITCQDKMNDYKKIRRDPTYSKLRTIDTYRIHHKSKLWLEKSLKNSSASTNIVITHHAPSLKSAPAHFQTDPLTSAYVSSLEPFILEHQPNYWIHGHIHTPCNYQVGNTNVICNPHGYIDERFKGFNKELIIEV